MISLSVKSAPAAPFVATGARPKIAILREQGVNGHVEMAAAFDRAGFTAVDVHMTDIIAGHIHFGYVTLAAVQFVNAGKLKVPLPNQT